MKIDVTQESERRKKKMYFVSRKKYKIAQYQKERRRTDEKCFILVLKFSIVSNCQASSSVRKIYIYFHSHSSLLLSVRGKNPQNNRHAKKKVSTWKLSLPMSIVYSTTNMREIIILFIFP